MYPENAGIIERYGDFFTKKEFITNPAIGRDDEIKDLSLVLLTPDKSAILTGKPGIGKTAIVEGLAYKIMRQEVPSSLFGYSIVKIDTQALIGTVKETGDTRIQTLVEELKNSSKIILFIDEIHTLINSDSDTSLDLANMFKTGLGRGDIKVIGATTDDEYERYILKDKAFVRRFQRIKIEEPTEEQTVQILIGTLPKIEKIQNSSFAYTPFIKERIMKFIVETTREFNRIYEVSGKYPDVALTLLNETFSYALFNNQRVVTIEHVYQAVLNSRILYPDVITKRCQLLKTDFKDLFDLEYNFKKDFYNEK